MTASDKLPRPYIDYLIGALSRQRYVRFMGFEPFPWQDAILASEGRRIIINAARQSGKSTIVSSLPCHKAKYKAGSLVVIIAATEDQAFDDMTKVKGYIQNDETYPDIKRSSDSLLQLDNGSRIVVVPATEKAARGKSCPDLVMLDEASRIEDIIYTSGVKPMFTDNPGQLILLSTPNGKKGFFFSIFDQRRKNDPWERYLIRSPYEPVSTPEGLDLAEYMPETDFQAKTGDIRSWYSPRHHDYDEQVQNLYDMGTRQYKQEYCCEFVETEASVFSYADVAQMFSHKPASPEPRVKFDRKPEKIDWSILEG